MVSSSIWVLIEKDPDIYMLEIFFGRLRTCVQSKKVV